MKKHGAPTDVFDNGVNHRVKLPNGYRLVIFNGQVQIIDVRALTFDRNLGQGDDRGDAMRVVVND